MDNLCLDPVEAQQSTVLEKKQGILDDPIFKIFTAIRCTQALQAAHELKLFPLLGKEAMPLESIAEALHIQTRAAQALLSLCASLELLEIKNGNYCLTNISKHYLLPDSPFYYGQMIDMAIQNSDIGSYERFKKGLLSNEAQIYAEQDLFEINEIDVKRTETFTRAMHSKSATAASFWPKIINLTQYKTLVDIGGGSGIHAISAAKHWPALHTTVFDRPLVCRIAEDYISNAGMHDRVTTHSGNMWKESFPNAEVHFYSDVFHDWPADKCQFLAEKSYQSLPKGGRIIIHELLFNDLKSGPLSTAVYNMIMLLWTQGQQYSANELMHQLKKVGFKETETRPTGFGAWSIVTGVK